MTTTTSLLYRHQPRIVKDEEEKKGGEENSEMKDVEEAEEEDNVDDDVDDDDESDGEGLDTFPMHQRFSGDIEAQKLLARSLLQSYAARPLDDSPMVVERTALFRRQITAAWNL
jgi:hypothetical protein